MQQGPFAPRALPRFNATTDPAATVSSSTVFPGPPVMRSTLLRRFLDGTRTASPVAWHVLVTVLSLPPRQRDVPHQIVWRHILLPSSDTRKRGLWGLFFCRGYLWVHLCYGPVLFFTLNREDFSFVIHLDRQPRTSRRREAQTGSRARSGSRSERTLDAVEHSRTLMEWWPFLIFHRGGLRIKVINNTR